MQKARFVVSFVVQITFGCAWAHAAIPADQWMSVILDGRKIGSMHTSRSVHEGRVQTTQEMRIELERSGSKMALRTAETDIETADGKPLAFSSITKMSGIENVVAGTLRDSGILDVTTTVGGVSNHRTMPWPQGALLAEGLRLASEKYGLTPGTHYSAEAFQPENLTAAHMESTVGNNEWLDLPGGRMRLVRVEQVVSIGGAQTRTIAWLDNALTLHKLLMPMLGYDLTMLACTQSCANAPNQNPDILAHALLEAPRAIPLALRNSALSIVFKAPNDDTQPLQFAMTDEQEVLQHNGEVELRITRTSDLAAPRERAPEALDRQPNDWLQSAAPKIQGLAHTAIGSATSPADQMQNLENFVRGYIRTKNLTVGYASALEVANNPEGDCTEHAVLLAALGRAAGIATRVVDGLVYVERYGGADHVFVPHAWVQAYVDGRWRSFDAALRGFDAGHIALAVGDGDPWRFYAGFNSIGRLQIESVNSLH